MEFHFLQQSLVFFSHGCDLFLSVIKLVSQRLSLLLEVVEFCRQILNCLVSLTKCFIQKFINMSQISLLLSCFLTICLDKLTFLKCFICQSLNLFGMTILQCLYQSLLIVDYLSEFSHLFCPLEIGIIHR